MNAVLPWLDKAGKFAIEHIPCPHFSQAVTLTAPRAGVLHTTEGGWDGSLGVFKSHLRAALSGRPRQDRPTRPGRHDRRGAGHPQLARDRPGRGGRLSKETPWFFDDATAEAVAALMAVCQAEYGIPLSRPWADGVYGMARANDPHRAAGKFGTRRRMVRPRRRARAG